MESIKQYFYFRPSRDTPQLPPANYNNLSIAGIDCLMHQSSPQIIMYCHGNSGNIYDRIHTMDAFKRRGYSIIMFDYSGYGKSTGWPSERQLYMDASIVFLHLTKMYAIRDIILYGESIGCPVASYVAKTFHVPKLILQCPPYNMSRVVLDMLPRFIKSCVSYLCKNDFDTSRLLRQYTGNALIMHGVDDTLIPISHGQSLARIGNHSFVQCYGGHNDVVIDWNALERYIRN